jgi:gentisate 1,2-dioxygenase
MSNATSVPLVAPAINPLSDATTARTATTYAEVHSLALELCEAEGYTLANAMRVAADDLDYYLDYVAPQWDRHAFFAGNDDALPF